MPYDKDREIENNLSWLTKSILGNFFIHKVDTNDLEHGRDFEILRVEPFSIAQRLRRFDYFPKFHNQFTIRWSRPSGVKTEIDKIRNKDVEYFFYGFLSPKEDGIIQYFIADLAKFGNTKPFQIMPNKPYDSELAVYNISQFPSDFILQFYCNQEYEKYKEKG